MEKYNNLDQNGKVQAYYMWIDASGQNLRLVTYTTILDKPISKYCI